MGVLNIIPLVKNLSTPNGPGWVETDNSLNLGQGGGYQSLGVGTGSIATDISGFLGFTQDHGTTWALDAVTSQFVPSYVAWTGSQYIGWTAHPFVAYYSTDGVLWTPVGSAPNGALINSMAYDPTTGTLLFIQDLGQAFITGNVTAGSIDDTQPIVQQTTISGSVTTGAFTPTETITQTGTGATATLYKNTTNFLFVNTVTGTPNATGIWTGGSSLATFTPTSTPTYWYTSLASHTSTQLNIYARTLISDTEPDGIGGGQSVPNSVAIWEQASIPGTLISGTFIPGSAPSLFITQDNSAAEAIVIGSTSTHLYIIFDSIFNTPDATSNWTQASGGGGIFTPKAVPSVTSQFTPSTGTNPANSATVNMWQLKDGQTSWTQTLSNAAGPNNLSTGSNFTNNRSFNGIWLLQYVEEVAQTQPALWQSTNQGTSWTSINTPTFSNFPSGNTEVNVVGWNGTVWSVFAFAPNNPGFGFFTATTPGTWTQRNDGSGSSPPTAGYPFGSNFPNNNGIVVGTNFVIGDNIDIATSTDNGVTWTVTTPAGGPFTYNNNAYNSVNGIGYLFVNGAAKNTVFSSTDGVTWTDLNLPNCGSVNDAQGDSKTLVIGGLRLDDGSGALWTHQPFTSPAKWSLVELDTNFVGGSVDGLAIQDSTHAVAMSNASTLHTTDGGNTWTRTAANAPTGSWGAVVAGAGVYVASYNTSFLARSTDNGVTWTNVTPSGSPTPTPLGASLFWSPTLSKFIVFDSASPRLFTSSDGSTWTTISITPTVLFATGLVDNGTTVVAVGSGNGNGTQYTLATTNGTSWTANSNTFGTNVVTTEAFSLNGVAWNGTKFLTFGQNFPGTTNYVYTSTDGIAWTKTASSSISNVAPFSGGFTIGVVGTSFVINDGEGNFPLYYIGSSTDGVTWTTVQVPFKFAPAFLHTGTSSPVYGNSGILYLAGGEGIITSTSMNDVTTYKKELPAGALAGITTGNGLIFGFGSTGSSLGGFAAIWKRQ